MNRPGFEFKSHQVNDSSQANQGTDHLISEFLMDTILNLAIVQFLKKKKGDVLSLRASHIW
jgi:hypothetical protein